jgi:hypothetical protein
MIKGLNIRNQVLSSGFLIRMSGAAMLLILIVGVLICKGQGNLVSDKQYVLKDIKTRRLYVWHVSQYPSDVTTITVWKGEKIVDSLFINDVRGIAEMSIKSDAFLDIKFMIRGGTDVSIHKEVIICLSNATLYKSLVVISDIVARVNEVYDKRADSLKSFDEKEDYHVLFEIDERDGNYKLIASESLEVQSKYKPSQNASIQKRHELSFDRGGCFFYSSFKTITRRKKILLSAGIAIEKYLNDEVPYVQFYDREYFLLDTDWCMDSGSEWLKRL